MDIKTPGNRKKTNGPLSLNRKNLKLKSSVIHKFDKIYCRHLERCSFCTSSKPCPLASMILDREMKYRKENNFHYGVFQNG